APALRRASARAASSSSARYTMGLAPASSSATIDLRVSLSSKATTSGGGLSSMHPNITPARLAQMRRADRALYTSLTTLKKSATPLLCPPQEAESVGQFGKKTKQFYGTLIVPLRL